jgi:manganese/iron transport system permease protein/iron/zinc/copper transport system permease protein
VTLAATLGFDPFEPFAYDFFLRGMLVAVLAGALCGLVGVYVVLRSMSYVGHGLSHAVFGGAAISAALGASYFLGAGLWGLFAALMIARVAGRGTVGADAAIGVVTTASFALGLAIQSRSGAVGRSLDAVLFGNVLGVRRVDVLTMLAVGLVVSAFVVAYRRELTFVTFDREVAAISGIPVARLDLWLMFAIAATVIVSARVIGALLISAMLVLPAATLRLVTTSIGSMLRWSPVLGAGCGLIGMYVSWYADVPSGAAITLLGTAVFAVAYLGSDVARRRPLGRIEAHAGVA